MLYISWIRLLLASELASARIKLASFRPLEARIQQPQFQTAVEGLESRLKLYYIFMQLPFLDQHFLSMHLKDHISVTLSQYCHITPKHKNAQK